jgi:hypothetical protein
MGQAGGVGGVGPGGLLSQIWQVGQPHFPQLEHEQFRTAPAPPV